MRRGMAAAVIWAAVIWSPAPALADDAPYVPWNQLLPGFPSDFRPSTFEDCADGDPTCIDRTIDEMYRRFHRVVGTCNHNAVFALTYIRVTEDYRDADDRGFFTEPKFLAHEDAVFARLYFQAYDNWAAGRLNQVPRAWRLAFDTGRDRKVSGIGNVLMGINAHVNRDMPFMLAGLGLTRPDGVSRKAEHDSFNGLLNLRYDDILAELTRRFDVTTDDTDLPQTTIDNLTLFQLLQGWREQVWRHAELLVNAPSDAARKVVSDYIESYAATIAETIRAFLGSSDSSERDALCARSGGQRPDNFTPPHLGPDPAADPPHQTIGAARPVLGSGLHADRKGQTSVRLRCAERPGDCKGSVLLLRRGAGGRRLGAQAFTVPAGATRTLRVRLGPTARRALRRSSSLRALLRVRTPDATSEAPYVTDAPTTLRRKR